MEEDPQPNQRDGQTGSAAGGPKGQRRQVGALGAQGQGTLSSGGPWPLPHCLPGPCVNSDELEEGRGAVSEGEPDAGDPKREVRSGPAYPPALALGSAPPTPLLSLAASALSAPEYPARPREEGGPGVSVPPPPAADPASPTQGHVPEPRGPHGCVRKPGPCQPHASRP